MSVRTMAKVWEGSSHAGSELLMLLAIADFADDDGKAFPSISTLAQKCRTTPRYAIKLLDALVASRELEVLKHGGVMGRGGKTNMYRVVLSRLNTANPKAVNPGAVVHPSSVVNPGTGSSAPGDNEVVHPSSPKPPENHQEPPVRAKRARSSVGQQTFADWYTQTKAISPKVFAENDPVYAYIESIGLTKPFMEVAWFYFKADHMLKDKRQKSWPQTFLNYLRKGWIRVWYRTEEGVWKLNTAGKQVAIENGLDPEMQTGGGVSDWTKYAI